MRGPGLSAGCALIGRRQPAMHPNTYIGPNNYIGPTASMEGSLAMFHGTGTVLHEFGSSGDHFWFCRAVVLEKRAAVAVRPDES